MALRVTLVIVLTFASASSLASAAA